MKVAVTLLPRCRRQVVSHRHFVAAVIAMALTAMMLLQRPSFAVAAFCSRNADAVTSFVTTTKNNALSNQAGRFTSFSSPPSGTLLGVARAEDGETRDESAAAASRRMMQQQHELQQPPQDASIAAAALGEKVWPTMNTINGSGAGAETEIAPPSSSVESPSVTSNVTHATTAAHVSGAIPNGEPQQQQQQQVTETSQSLGGEALKVESSPESSTNFLAIDPSTIEIVTLGPNLYGASPLPTVPQQQQQQEEASISAADASVMGAVQSSPSFVKMFRGSANYIANHRNTLAVYHIPGELLEWDGFKDLMDDIALTWLLGMKIVIVMGCRHQIDIRLHKDHVDPTTIHRSIRVTDMDTLRVVKEEAGYVRFEVERQLARSLRRHGSYLGASTSSSSSSNGNPNKPIEGNVVSGNFYSAQPFGVIDGIDYQYTGFPRRVEVEKIRQVHDSNDIVLLTTLGVSPSGEVFNVNSESLAATVASTLGASKLIYFAIQGTAFRNKETGKVVQNLRISDARNLLEHYHVKLHAKGFASVDPSRFGDEDEVVAPAVVETLLKVGWAMSALEKGVRRAHIIAPSNGALLQELYTRDGAGTLISRDLYEGIRRANVNDVAGIHDLISPLIRAGTLVDRPKNVLEKDILSYYVYTRDNLIVATGQLKRFEGGFAEIGCLVVSKDYRSQGRGDAMLGYLERLCLQAGASKVFVLSTQTMEWFVERGFREVDVDSLPPSRRATYNFNRRSKIYMKQIDGDRDLDASELWWNR